MFLNISSTIESIIGYSHAELLNKNPLDLIHPEDIDTVKSAFLESLFKPNNPIKTQFRFKKANGEYILLDTIGLNFFNENSGNDLFRNPDNTEINYGCGELSDDIFNQKNETLNEIHRKVTGTLQLILSLLKLQANYTFNNSIRKHILSEHSRIKAISLVCNLLHRSADKSKINMEEYLYDLATNLFVTFENSKKHTSVKISAFDVSFNVETAVPFGLIVNELLLNSLDKKVNHNRVVEIKLYKSFNDTYTFEYLDSGLGYNHGINNSDFKAFEMKLIDILVKQLEGRMYINTLEGLVSK